MIATFDAIKTFAEERLNEAVHASVSIQFSEIERYAKSAQTRSLEASSIGDVPAYNVLECGYGVAANAVIVSVDLRASSKRAIEIGPKDTYISMHTFLSTMAEIVRHAGGLIVGLRGDGLIAGFGVKDKDDPDANWEEGPRAAKRGTHCGKAMIEAVDDIINPLLVSESIEGGLQIGVGVSAGEVVITRIGLRCANEVTAYGPPVNQACHLTERSTRIRLHRNAYSLFPTSKEGKLRFLCRNGAYLVKYPSNMNMLDRSVIKIRQEKPK